MKQLVKKIGITSADPAHCLEILQSIAFVKQEEEYNKNLIQLQNTKVKSVVHYCEENWFKFKEKYFKNQVLNLGQNTSKRLESAFNKIKSICSEYAGLMQFFTEFFTVLKSLHSFPNELSKKEHGHFH